MMRNAEAMSEGYSQTHQEESRSSCAYTGKGGQATTLGSGGGHYNLVPSGTWDLLYPVAVPTGCSSDEQPSLGRLDSRPSRPERK